MSKILCTDPLPPGLVDRVRTMLPDGVSFEAVPTWDEGDYARLAADADALLVIHSPTCRRWW